MASFRPHPMLLARVVSIDVLETQGGDDLVLPSTSAVLGFQFRGRVRAGVGLLAPAGVTGLQQVARTYSYLAGTGSVLVRFTPQGTACLGVPAVDLANRSVALDAILPRARVAEVCSRLQEASDTPTRVSIVERFLTELPFVGDPLVARAIEMLGVGGVGDAAVSAVARALGKSERQLERRFLARVGIMPKRFVALRRFEQAVAAAATAPSLAAAALDAGYYDQSHFIRDFRRFAGVAPRELLRRSR